MLRGELKWGRLSCERGSILLPSHQENFGIAVVEALACGVPVLISDKVNIWREVEADGAGIVGSDSVEGTVPQSAVLAPHGRHAPPRNAQQAARCFAGALHRRCHGRQPRRDDRTLSPVTLGRVRCSARARRRVRRSRSGAPRAAAPYRASRTHPPAGVPARRSESRKAPRRSLSRRGMPALRAYPSLVSSPWLRSFVDITRCVDCWVTTRGAAARTRRGRAG